MLQCISVRLKIYMVPQLYLPDLKSITTGHNGIKNEMSNAVVFMRERTQEDVEGECEERVSSPGSDKLLGITVSPLPILSLKRISPNICDAPGSKRVRCLCTL